MIRPSASFRRRSDMALGAIFRGFVVIALPLVLAGCQPVGKGGMASDIASPEAIQGPAVEVTPLAPMGPDPAATAVAEQKPPAAAKPKSESHLACEKRGGNYVPLGKSGALTCQMPTRDAGKQCRKESDCDGVCLARSRTCAPAKPLFGCQSILQEDGVRVDLCID